MHTTNEVITIVSGLPRSGTSMMMRMLEAGGLPPLIDHIRIANEDNPAGYYEFEPVKRTKQDPSWLAKAPGHAVKMVYRLLYDLPATNHYRVLMMRREISEVLASQRTMLKREDLDDHVADEQMAAVFKAELARTDKWLALQPNFSVLNVDYNRIVLETGPVVAEIEAFLNVGLNLDDMCNVIDMGLYRNRRETSVTR
ncbi:sulfotransferase family protein [Schlesneria paludicola]|uniref:sulfotransferase family protein n=1 Tax=Schlesneria paludicola TaxID=360056 RepID=UPI000299F276|nr:sulfotransferase family protein [Schlesneria paludicola]